jgi:ectoine hydroxylase-related dioxygenase (phytanoyl-CoA dioxygenase family)
VRFHYDVHGFNFVYVNFYLSDTDRDSGAHVLIAGSHRDKSLRQLFGSARISDEAALRRYGAERVRIIEAKAGSGFFEDTACYHKALPPSARDRLMLQLRYQ